MRQSDPAKIRAMMPAWKMMNLSSWKTAWAALQHAIMCMLAIFGGVAAVAERLILTRAGRIEILQWLAQIEATARRLILVEALKLPPPNAPPSFVPLAKLATAYADKPRPELPEDPEQWNVRFHVWSGARPAVRKTIGVQATRSHAIQFNAIPLARRMEAVRRLFDQRQAYAQRLALRVHHARARALKVFAPYRHRATAVQTLLRQVQAEVDLALGALKHELTRLCAHVARS